APVRTLPPVLIDPGHGGEDGGAVSGDVLEKHINLAVSHDVADLLRLCGYTVSMTRDTDDALTNEGEDVRKRKYNDMKMRLDLYNATPDNVVVSIHQNKFDAAASHGAQVFYSPNHPNSAVLAEALRKSVTGMLQPDNTRTCKAAGKEIFLLKNAQVPAVIVECGFISNRQERELLVTDDYQKQLALAIAAGLMNYVNTN
ncbi:MAG: N-acetylmuramoyl-L-alanine amidase, partial [Ruminococcus sp.]|nr:N-acetylmuramoyl-L-alanine amidase [Ruminococcus sp.]